MRGLTFVNADMGSELPSTLRIEGPYIASLGEAAAASDRVVDLRGDRLLPGLINTHEHLQLNCFPEVEYGRNYGNASEWVDDLNARTSRDTAFLACKATPRDLRLVQGGIKNLLCGVTTVAHHDPLYPILSNPSYPTQVVHRYGWSHSLWIDGPAKLQASHRSTPPGWPWIVHAAEGVDAEAAGELDRLDALGCLGSNTLLVHGVALDREGRARVADAGAGLIWCPSSNLRLFGRTAEVRELVEQGRVALGTDSRLTGARDLFYELRIASELEALDDAALESLVTSAAARLLRLTDRGVLRAGALADLVVIPAGTSLARVTRGDVRLVLLGGVARYGDPDHLVALLGESQTLAIRVDGCEKRVEKVVGGWFRGSSCGCPEQGVAA